MEFELEVLAFIARHENGAQYLQKIGKTFFAEKETQNILRDLTGFFERFNEMPTLGSFKRYCANESLTEQLDAIWAFNISKFVEVEILDALKSRALKKAALDYSANWKNRGSADKFLEATNAIKALDQEVLGVTKQVLIKSGNVFEGASSRYKIRVESHKTQYAILNASCESGGFHPPELIVFFAEPKAGKTLHLLNLAVGHAMYGLNVAYIDAENGDINLQKRFEQKIMGSTVEALQTPKMRKELGNVRHRMGWLGGQLRFYCYPPRSVDPMQVFKDIMEDGYLPDVLVWDYPDRFQSSRIVDNRDPRLRVQGVYTDITALNIMYNTVSYAVSQTTKASLGKEVFDMTDLAEDFAKAANATAGYAICQTPDEEALGLERIITAWHRNGRAFRAGAKPMIFQVNKATQELIAVGYKHDLEAQLKNKLNVRNNY